LNEGTSEGLSDDKIRGKNYTERGKGKGRLLRRSSWLFLKRSWKGEIQGGRGSLKKKGKPSQTRRGRTDALKNRNMIGRKERISFKE